MKQLFLVSGIAAALLGAAEAVERPTFELMGLPITPHQAALLDTAHIRERSPTPTLEIGGMPASPHQLSVVRPPVPPAASALTAEAKAKALSAE